MRGRECEGESARARATTRTLLVDDSEVHDVFQDARRIHTPALANVANEELVAERGDGRRGARHDDTHRPDADRPQGELEVDVVEECSRLGHANEVEGIVAATAAAAAAAAAATAAAAAATSCCFQAQLVHAALDVRRLGLQLLNCLVGLAHGGLHFLEPLLERSELRHKLLDVVGSGGGVRHVP